MDANFGVKKEISTPLGKLDLKKIQGVKVTRGRKKSISSFQLEREILSTSVNYNNAPSLLKGKGRGVGT